MCYTWFTVFHVGFSMSIFLYFKFENVWDDWEEGSLEENIIELEDGGYGVFFELENKLALVDEYDSRIKAEICYELCIKLFDAYCSTRGMTRPINKIPNSLKKTILKETKHNLEKLKNNFLYDSSSGKLYKKRKQNKCCIIQVCKNLEDKDKYLSFKYEGVRYLVHRVVWALYYGDWPIRFIDHRDGDKQNNKIEVVVDGKKVRLFSGLNEETKDFAGSVCKKMFK